MVATMGEFYPELVQKRGRIFNVIGCAAPASARHRARLLCPCTGLPSLLQGFR